METPFKAGFAALVGRPNVGKSTLLNALLGERVSIVTPKPQTTRTRLNGILNLPNAQLIFTDTPGVSHHFGRSRLHRAMNREAGAAVGDSDLTVLVLEIGGTKDDVSPRIPSEDVELVAKAREQSQETGGPILVVNKTDRIRPKERLLPWIAAYAEETGISDIIPISALHEEGLGRLVEALVERLPESPALFPDDMHTDRAERFLCEELVREQLLLQTHEEVPHRAAVIIEVFEDGRDDGGDLCHLEGRIYVERDSQKAIVIGKRGARIREVSEKARHRIADLLGCRVYLRLTVHVDQRWTDSERALRRYGFYGGDEI